MNSIFDEIIPRRGTNSCKWDSHGDEGTLPMWVADMDFRTAPAIIDALKQRVEHGIFGYTHIPQRYYDATINWFKRRHNWVINPDWIIYTSGVVPALSAIIKALTSPGDKILAQTPVYNCFFSSIRNNGCEVVSNSLIRKDDTYIIDFDDFEKKAADPAVKLFLLCNPHNPAGRVWTKDELTRLGNICIKHNVIVVSDEIHCELVFNNYKYTPFASISPEFQKTTITCCSPSKSFNIAGLQIANIISSDTLIRERINKAININEVCDVNPFGIEALIAAYEQGENWLKELVEYLHSNYLITKEFFEEKMPNLQVLKLEGTYLAWVDCKSLNISSEEIKDILMKRENVLINEGTMYGDDGEGYIRINLACPKSVLLEGLNRIYNALKNYIK